MSSPSFGLGSTTCHWPSRRDELEQWVEHLDGCDVPHSAIADMTYGSLVVLRDPDNIQLELFALAPNFRLDVG